jgi:hypothetical protein
MGGLHATDTGVKAHRLTPLSPAYLDSFILRECLQHLDVGLQDVPSSEVTTPEEVGQCLKDTAGQAAAGDEAWEVIYKI